MPVTVAIRDEAARLQALFQAGGAVPVEADVLQPAETLLDLYGEDIRARAYVTQDPLRGEQMLRPDFTVPVVQMHMAAGADEARYTYCGEVFRRQESDATRPSEYLQVGLELIGGQQPEVADAEVFARVAQALTPMRPKAAIGDIGLLVAAVEGLPVSKVRRRALRRHLWRPKRFRALLDRFAGRAQVSTARQALLERMRAGEDPLRDAGPEAGRRSAAEVRARLDVLLADAAEPDLPTGSVELLDALMSVRETAPAALEHLRDIAVDMPAIADAVTRLDRRLDALARADVNPSDLEFEASYGRTTLEYYDGFVFGLFVPGRPDLPPIATGGRYDALTRQLGGGRALPAVGGVIRPALAVTLRDLEGAA